MLQPQDCCILEDSAQQVAINVGGYVYTASLRTLRAQHDSHLSNVFAGNWRIQRNAQGEIFIDRDGEAFRTILGYLRALRDHTPFILPPLGIQQLLAVKQEAMFYALAGLADQASAGLLRHVLYSLANLARSDLINPSQTDASTSRSQAGQKLLDPDQDYSLELLAQAGGLASIMASLSSPLLRMQQLATGALWFLTSQNCSHIEVQPDQLGPALVSLMTFMSSDDQELQENATGVLANLADHPSVQSKFEEAEHLLVLLRLVVEGSPVTQDSCSTALEQLAAHSVPGHGFCRLPVVTELIYLLTSFATRIQLVSLRILQGFLGNVFEDNMRHIHLKSWDASSPIPLAIQHFIKRRGMMALKSLLQEPDTEELAALCLSILARLQLSWSAFGSSGTMQLLLQKLARPGPPGKAQAAATQWHAARAVAILMEDAECAKVALQPANLRLILQLFHAPAKFLWQVALDMVTSLLKTSESQQAFAASGALDASIVQSMLWDAASYGQSDECRQAQLLLDLSRLSSCHQSLVDGGAIKYLSKQVDSPSNGIRQKAANTLTQLTANAVAVSHMFASGIPAKLIQRLQLSEDDMQAIAVALCMQKLARSEDDKVSLANLGSLPPLIKLLSSTSPDAKVWSAGAIMNICSHHDANRQQASELGALPPLMAMLSSDHPSVRKAGRECLNTLGQTAAVKQQIQNLQSK